MPAGRGGGVVIGPRTIVELIVAVALCGATWQVQTWRYGAKEAAHAKQDHEEAQARAAQALATVQQNAAVAIRRADNVIAAQDAATRREALLRADADGVRRALASLHDAAADALHAAAQSQAACLAHAATLSELFSASAKRYGDLAEKADGHASDVKTLTDAWPE